MNLGRFPVRQLTTLLVVLLLSGCGGSSDSGGSGLLSSNINLIFVTTPDLAYQAPGDVDPSTANLTSQGLQRSLLMATYLKEQLLEQRNVTAIYALSPMTHLQTAHGYPDMGAIGYIQQFALLNQITLLKTTANSYPIRAAYAPGSVPDGVVQPSPFIPGAQGLDFRDAANNNTKLATEIIDAGVPGYHVFSAPWETVSALISSIKQAKGYSFEAPTAYAGPNVVYAISITPSRDASLFTFDSGLKPSASFPVLPAPVQHAACTQQTPFTFDRHGGVSGAVIPANINRNETLYLIRHAEAHPSELFEDGNYVGAGQWRALSLPDALRAKISPSIVYSIDPAQSFSEGPIDFSYVRPSLTVLPYAIANNLPYNLAASFFIGQATDPAVAKATNDFFLTGGSFSNQTILLAWEHNHFPPIVTDLLQRYGGTEAIPSLTWPQSDYDTIWTIKLDAAGNLTVNNTLCEGIDSASLPEEAPEF